MYTHYTYLSLQTFSETSLKHKLFADSSVLFNGLYAS